LANTEVACGEAECAATPTVHFAASFALEWWCVTIATAEHNVSSRHSNAIRFENEHNHYRKNKLSTSTPRTETNATGIPRHGIADVHSGLGTVVTRAVGFRVTQN
jgi:hypothetical protein